MKAMPFDKDEPIRGDSEFYAPDSAVDYNEGDTFETLRTRYIQKEELVYSLTEPTDGLVESLGGFWVIEDSVLDQTHDMWPIGGCRRDGEVYATNRVVKVFLRGQAIKTIT